MKRLSVYLAIGACVILAVGLVIAIRAANDAADRANQATARAVALEQTDAEIAEALQLGCGRANVLREATHWLYEQKLQDAKVVGATATTPEIRQRFVDSAIETSRRLDGLDIRPGGHPDPDKPWLVDCEAAYPVPTKESR